MQGTISVTRRIGARDITIEQGLLALQASGSVTVRIGDTLHVKFRVGSMRASKSKPGWGIVNIPCELVNQKGEVVQRGEHKLMIPRRPGAPAAA